MRRERSMALAFAVGSIWFTLGGAMQTRLAVSAPAVSARVDLSAVAGYVVASSASMVNQAAANCTTAAGAACFLACALASLRGDPG